ncbi:MAG: protoheme IX farnesyltransferase [Gemmatimonadetes bacterium RBG_16_66_8]|nr:MAG: protoheme IX farnesyltransferase [Gemmatimonadetes bacterium RBG_16_66_8]
MTSTLRALIELTKPRIVMLVVITVVAGFLVAPAPEGALAVTLLHAAIGTALVAAGTNALNQVAERDVDAIMRRTQARPLPTGRLDVRQAQVFAWTAGIAGVTYLAVFVNTLTAVLAAATLVSYVFVYTPLKRRTTLATVVGAVPGALPVLGGWAATGAGLGREAWILFGIVFLWQLPHFLALAWLYRDDYRRAGLRMLSVEDSNGRKTFSQAAVYAAALLPVSLAPALGGAVGLPYFLGALALSLWLVWASMRALRWVSDRNAARLFGASVTYLPVLLVLMVLDRLA